MKGNYKSAMHAFYDAKAGLEEGRGRSVAEPEHSQPGCELRLPGAGGDDAGEPGVLYRESIRRRGGEPLDLSVGNPYADLEYQQEWGIPVTSAAVQQPFINSTSPIPSANIAGPLYKWVRITPRTQASAKLGDTTDTNPLFTMACSSWRRRAAIPRRVLHRFLQLRRWR